jgi:hypothetical protein
MEGLGMRGNGSMGWYGFTVGFSVTLVVGLLFVLAVSPDSASVVERWIRRDVLPVWNHGKDPQFKVPPLVREDKQQQALVRVREK